MLTKHSFIVSESSSLFTREDSISTLLKSKYCGEYLPLLMSESSSSSLIGMSYVSCLLILYIFSNFIHNSLADVHIPMLALEVPNNPLRRIFNDTSSFFLALLGL
jgi:hypothetical protein